MVILKVYGYLKAWFCDLRAALPLKNKKCTFTSHPKKKCCDQGHRECEYTLWGLSLMGKRKKQGEVEKTWCVWCFTVSVCLFVFLWLSKGAFRILFSIGGVVKRFRYLSLKEKSKSFFLTFGQESVYFGWRDKRISHRESKKQPESEIARVIFLSLPV